MVRIQDYFCDHTYCMRARHRSTYQLEQQILQKDKIIASLKERINELEQKNDVVE